MDEEALENTAVQETSAPPRAFFLRPSSLFAPSGNDHLIGRTRLSRLIYDQITARLSGTSPHGAIYLCGIPGTGKTLTLRHTIHKLVRNKVIQPIDFVVVNCKDLVQTKAIFDKIYRAIFFPAASSGSRCLDFATLAQILSASPVIERLVIAIDEMDDLSPELVLSLYKLSYIPNKRIVVVGTSNTIVDFSAKNKMACLTSLPRLPATHLFTAYTKAEIQEIVEAKLVLFKRHCETPRCRGNPYARIALAPNLIHFCAAQSDKFGDLRLAFGLFKAIFMHYEALVDRDLAEHASEHASEPPLQRAYRVELSVVRGILKARGDTSNAMAVKNTYHQDLLLCAYANAIQDNPYAREEVYLNKLLKQYSQIAKAAYGREPSKEDFNSILRHFETIGIIEYTIPQHAVRVTEFESVRTQLMGDDVLRGHLIC